MMKKWTDDETELVALAVRAHYESLITPSIRSLIRLLSVFLPDRSWESIRSKFRQLVRSHRQGEWS